MAAELEAHGPARDELKARAAALYELNVPVGAGGPRSTDVGAG